MDVYREQSWWNFSCDLYISLFDGRPKRHRSDLQKCLWMEILFREKLHVLIYFVLFLTTLWMCYWTIKGILGSCELLCLLFSMLFNFWKKIQKLRFWFFFWGGFFCCELLWVVLRSLWILVNPCGILVDRCGSFWVLVTTRNSTATTEEWHININKKALNWGNFRSKLATGSEDEQPSLWP